MSGLMTMSEPLRVPRFERILVTSWEQLNLTSIGRGRLLDSENVPSRKESLIEWLVMVSSTFASTEDTELRSRKARLVQWEPLGHSGIPKTTILNFLSLSMVGLRGLGGWVGAVESEVGWTSSWIAAAAGTVQSCRACFSVASTCFWQSSRHCRRKHEIQFLEYRFCCLGQFVARRLEIWGERVSRLSYFCRQVSFDVC